jgi:hypothetical protein
MSDEFLGQGLIFIISQPRSGSTLLQRVLAGHPEVETSAETWLMLHPLYALKQDGIQTEFNHRSARRGVADFLTHYTEGEAVYIRALRAWAGEIYGDAIARSGKRFFLDKTPRYFFILPQLFRVLPEAKFVFLLRNPLAVLASELKTYVKDKWEVLAWFEPDLRRAPDLLLSGMAELGDRAITVRYESFVENPESELRTLCGRLGLSFQPVMLDYSKTPEPKGRLNDPVGIHQHQTPSRASVDKWRWMLDDPQACHFAECYLRDLGPDTLKAFGYPYESLLEAFVERGRTRQGRGRLFPWHLAIRNRSEWTYRERVQAERYYAWRVHGGLKGELMGLRRAWRIAKIGLRSQLRLTRGG